MNVFPTFVVDDKLVFVDALIVFLHVPIFEVLQMSEDVVFEEEVWGLFIVSRILKNDWMLIVFVVRMWLVKPTKSST